MREAKHLETKVRVMDEAAVGRAMMRLSYEIVERTQDLSKLLLVGIRTRGVPLAELLAANIQRNGGQRVPVESLNITFYRDDLERLQDSPTVGAAELSAPIDGREIILVDDVLFTGRTARAAIDALFSLGRPGKIRLAVLVDRGHRELPIRPDYVGKNVPTSLSEVIRVHLAQTDGETAVEICKIVE